jgi:hypothetical protein
MKEDAFAVFAWELRRDRVREELKKFLVTIRALQKAGHNMDDILQILCDNLDDIGTDLVILEELREMCGRHRG